MQRTKLIEKYIKRIMIDYPEEDKLHISLTQFAQEVLEIAEDNKYKDLLEALQNMSGVFDNPIARRQINTEFAEEAREIARKTIEKYK